MKIRPILRGILSYIPLLKNILPEKGTGGSSSAEYCYSVWMRHLKHLESCGLEKVPDVIGELGPGDSLGVGIAAILSGSDKYYALDIIEHSEIEKNIFILNRLVDLFRNFSKIPDGPGFAYVRPRVESYSLPNLINASLLEKNISDARINEIKNELRGEKSTSAIFIKYIVPWDDNKTIINNSVDLIFSQAVMEHVTDISHAYLKMHCWLKPGGYLSHQIDFKAHETHNKWYGHYTYTEAIWHLIMRGRKYDINRLPLSAHLKALINNEFELLKVVPDNSERIPASFIKRRFFKEFTEEDKITSSALIIARKK